MTEVLLKRELEPLARQRQRFKMLVALAIAWSLIAAIAFGAFLIARYVFPVSTGTLLAGVAALAVISAIIASKIVNRTAPDFRDIARKIETTKPELHTLLLTAV